MVVDVGGGARLAGLAGFIPPVGQVAGDASIVGIEVGGGAGADAGLVDGEEAGGAADAGLRGIVPPGVGGAGDALSECGIPEIGRGAGDASVVGRNEASFGGADAAKLCGLKDVGFRAAGLVVGLEMGELLCIEAHEEDGKEKGELHHKDISI